MKKENHNYAVILAGGMGSRFWPLSRSLEPKQFLSIFGPNSLFHETISRIKTTIRPENIFIITNQLYFPEIFNYTSIFKIPRSNIVFEPEGKNTAASIAVANRLINLIDSEAKVLVLPSDHLIKNNKGFRSLLRYVFSEASVKNNLVVFGIAPDYAAQGYGYIKIQNAKFTLKGTGKMQNYNIYRVEKFVEKPDVGRANRFFKDKRYFWNSGMFFGSVRVFLDKIKENLPATYRLISQVYESGDIKAIWKDIKSISFDYGVLEKTKDILMIPVLNLGWSDLGTWSSLDKVLPKDKSANTIKADAIVSESKNITVLGKDRLIACLGLENLIVVDTPDALLIARKDRSEEVKKVVERLKKDNRQEVQTHRTVKRPWGSFTVLDKGLGFKIKVVEVLPKKALSLQKHSRRSEHWVVVEGKAKITKGRKVFYINVNESTFIPQNSTHRLENPTDCLLRIVEVQSGHYLEEDDITRIKDDFERNRQGDIGKLAK
ncbi:MAG: mannose-1-phosphate guanylyltransferase/mannose-6-phosphate isomerase [Candidatus Omnitrophica bacterium]|nr:mannose-1-phosphate guanylyltransferase/mannose-6-phosphate isomerase [Candidatus Omnitrophota bacterium]MBU2436720.1 mannose-1-phosphate guanylyltransferase/mannose-6-phosphate isomerase [Candidatus Omnitrophota bacterium]